jgi:hypothetical protein
MRLLLLTLLLLGSALAQDTTTEPNIRRRTVVGHPEVQQSRRLSSSEDNQNSNEDDAYNNDDTSMFSQAKDRFGEDVLSMWSSPPNEWIDEYWEVLGGVLAFMLLSLCCCLGCCLLPLWSPRDEPKAPSKTLLNIDPTNNNELKPGSSENAATKGNDATSNKNEKAGLDEPMILEGPPSLEQPIWGPSNSLTQSKADEPSATQLAPLDKVLSYDTYASGYDTPAGPAGSPRGKKKRQSLWSQRKAVWTEVVSAWSEFLGCSDEAQEHAYNKYKEPALTTTLRKKSSSPRKSKAPRNYKAPSLRRKSDIEYEAAASSSNQHKVGKYDGMVV